MTLIGEIKLGALFRTLALTAMLMASLAFADETNLTFTVDGVTYSNVTFGTVTPSSVSVRHSTGVATVPLEKLSPDLQQRFGYDPAKAAQWRQQEARRQAQAAQRQQQELLRRQQVQATQEKCTTARNVSLKVERVRPDGLIGDVYIQRYRIQPPVIVPDHKEYIGKFVFLEGYPNQIAEGNGITCKAVKVGTIDVGEQRVLERWVYCGPADSK